MRYLSTILFTLSLTATQAQIQFSFNNNAAASGVTSPSDVDSLFYWFAADVSVLDSAGATIGGGEGVGTWTDLSGNGYDVVQSDTTKDPMWCSTCGPNGYPAVVFNGTDEFLASSAHWWGSDDLTVFVVMKFNDPTRVSSDYVICRILSTGDRQFYFYTYGDSNGNGIRFAAASNSGQATTNFSTIRDATFSIYSICRDGSLIADTLRKNSSVQSVSSFSPGTSDGSIRESAVPLEVGSLFNGTDGFADISISEIIVYSRDLTTSERESIENYLNTKYSIFYLIIFGFPVSAKSRRRHLIQNEKKKAA